MLIFFEGQQIADRLAEVGDEEEEDDEEDDLPAELFQELEAHNVIQFEAFVRSGLIHTKASN